jgi:transposase
MKKITLPNQRDTILSIQEEIHRSDDSKYDHRLHALLLVTQGMSCRQVAALMGDAPRTVAYWIQRFKESSFSGLIEGERSGRPCKLDQGQLDKIGSVIRQPTSEVGLDGPWDGKTLSEYIFNTWDIDLGVRQCQRLFKQLGFRFRKPRPKIARAEPIVQAEFKKKL